MVWRRLRKLEEWKGWRTRRKWREIDDKKKKGKGVNEGNNGTDQE